MVRGQTHRCLSSEADKVGHQTHMSRRKGILRPLSGHRIPPPPGRQSWLQELGCKKQAHTASKAGRRGGRQAGCGGGKEKRGRNSHLPNKSKSDQNNQVKNHIHQKGF